MQVTLRGCGEETRTENVVVVSKRGQSCVVWSCVEKRDVVGDGKGESSEQVM